MAKGYPVRPEAADPPECHACGSQRIAQREPRRCLDCGAVLHDDPFAIVPLSHPRLRR